MGRLKEKWRTLAEPVCEYWRQQFVSSRSQADIRRELAAKLQVKLNSDSQLNKFRDWVKDQDARDAEAERMSEDEQRLTEEFGKDWSLDRIREEVLRRSYARAIATGDFASGRKTIVQDLNVKKLALDRDKFEFDAAKAALKYAGELKAIKSNKNLSEAEKVDQARLKLFGVEEMN